MAQSIQFLDKIGGGAPQGGTGGGGSFGEPPYSGGGDSFNQAPQGNQGFGNAQQQAAPTPAPTPIDDDLPF